MSQVQAPFVPCSPEATKTRFNLFSATGPALFALPSSMPLEVRRITSPTDFETFVSIQIAAFAKGGGIISLLTPSPITDDYVQKSIEKHIKSWKEESDVVYLKVVDTDLDGGKMIAGAKWRINDKERSEEAAQKMYPAPDEKDMERQGLVDFMGYLSRVRKEYSKCLCTNCMGDVH